MGHEDRHGHLLEDLAGHAAQDQLAQARMAVGAHDQQVDVLVCETREQGVADRQVLGIQVLGLDGDAVAGQVERNVGTRLLARLSRLQRGC